MSENIDIDHPEPPDSLPDEIVDFVQESDMYALADLESFLDRELTVRSSVVLETSESELPEKYLRSE
jgi:hypothetical protein